MGAREKIRRQIRREEQEMAHARAICLLRAWARSRAGDKVGRNHTGMRYVTASHGQGTSFAHSAIMLSVPSHSGHDTQSTSGFTFTVHQGLQQHLWRLWERVAWIQSSRRAANHSFTRRKPSHSVLLTAKVKPAFYTQHQRIFLKCRLCFQGQIRPRLCILKETPCCCC